MSSIAYITDNKMLELHRLNNHRTMNFWRTSSNLNFTDFTVGDLVFFLSKDKEQMNQKEKGIVGFGRVKKIHSDTIKKIWDLYGDLNGYKTLEEFKIAIKNVSKEKSLPKKISSFYLENVVFFQPIYLSECGVNISRNVESYIYIKPEEVVMQLLKLAKENKDMWSRADDEEIIENEENVYSLFEAYKKIGTIPYPDNKIKKVYNALNEYKDYTLYEFIQNSKSELYKFSRNELTILFYHDKESDNRLLIGQAKLLKDELNNLCPRLIVHYRTLDGDSKIEYLMNN